MFRFLSDRQTDRQTDRQREGGKEREREFSKKVHELSLIHI